MENYNPVLESSSLVNILTLRYDPSIESNLPKKTWNDLKPLVEKPSIDLIEKLIEKTLRKQIDVSYVKKICIALSGGIDSTLILTLIKKILPDIQVDAISIKKLSRKFYQVYIMFIFYRIFNVTLLVK